MLCLSDVMSTAMSVKFLLVQFGELLPDAVKFPRIWCQIVAVPFSSLSAVLDSFHRTVGTENWVRDLVQAMGVLHLAFHHQTLPFRPFGLHVVLPEEPFFLVRRSFRGMVELVIGIS